MALDKAIKSGKEHRKRYRKAKLIDPSCRNHGNCKWCEENRLHQELKIKEIIKNELKKNGENENV